MAETTRLKSAANVSFCSSLKDDAWHNLAGPNAFESWHFDAVSDDGREAVVITFYDNYVLSPRFYANAATAANVIHSGKHRFPAVSLVYLLDGKPVLSSVNEYVDGDFLSGPGNGCSIGRSSFRVDTAKYGSGFMVTVDLRTFGGRRIRADLEWLLIESDLRPAYERSDAVWNVVAPRADVSGKIMLIGRRGKTRNMIQFRGTGYHDQVTSANVHYRDLTSRLWGRAHFVDSTIVFDRLGGTQDRAAPGNFYLIRDGEIHDRIATCEAGEHKRDRWGLSVPGRISFVSDDNIKLRVKPVTAFRSGFTEVKMLSEITLSLRDGKPRKTIGITEFVDPRRLKSRLFRWISDLRIGREDRSPLF
jgi:carotenoid 1,2-hydratase